MTAFCYLGYLVTKTGNVPLLKLQYFLCFFYSPWPEHFFRVSARKKVSQLRGQRHQPLLSNEMPQIPGPASQGLSLKSTAGLKALLFKGKRCSRVTVKGLQGSFRDAASQAQEQIPEKSTKCGPSPNNSIAILLSTREKS